MILGVQVWYALSKPPGRQPKRFARHYLMFTNGPWRDIVLAFAGRVIALGGGARLRRCKACDQPFVMRRSTATFCRRQECRKARSNKIWKRWIKSPTGKAKRIKGLLQRYEQEGWELGARGGLGAKRRGRKKR